MDKEIRIAQLEDLTKIKDMYKDIVKNMYDNNINLYEKNGFKKAKGIYKEYIDEELILYEYGYEMNCI